MTRWIMLFSLTLALLACGGSSDDGNTGSESTASQLPTSAPGTNGDDAALAATVNGDPIYVAELEILLTNNTALAGAASTDALRAEILEDRIKQVLMRQYAEQNGIVIADADVQTEIAALQALANDADIALTTVMGLPENAETSMIEQSIYDVLLTEAVEAHVFERADLDTTQVRARHILVADQEQAQRLLERLNNGESFVALAAEASLDSSTAAAGGDLGWIARGDLLQLTVEDVLFGLPAQSRYPEAIQSSLGWHIVEVLELSTELALSDEQIAQQRLQIFENWLASLRANADIIRFIS